MLKVASDRALHGSASWITMWARACTPNIRFRTPITTSSDAGQHGLEPDTSNYDPIVTGGQAAV